MKRVILFSLVVLASFVGCDDRRNKVPPEQAAQQFAADLGLKVQGKPNCSGIDSDGDGYVTCTIALAGAKEGEPPKTMSLQCAGVTSANGCDAQTSKYVVGCKETQPKVLAPQQGS